MDRDPGKCLCEAQCALIDPPGLRVRGVGNRMGEVFGTDAAVDLCDRGPLVGIGDHQPAPVLCVACRGRLHRQPDAFEDDIGIDRSGQVEALAHRACGGEQFVDR